MSGLGWVVVASVLFVGSHLLLSHALRRPVVALAGERGFSGVYSAVAAATMAGLVVAVLRAPATAPLWPVGDALWAAATVVMLAASVLLVGSLVRNPAFPGAGAPGEPRGVFAVTRHPMMWSFALWSACHVAVFPQGKTIVLSAAVAVLALGGSALQDRKKAAGQPGTWPAWQARTSYWPFAAALEGRARLAGFGGHALGGGLLVWLAATWAHGPLAGWPAGIWRWVG